MTDYINQLIELRDKDFEKHLAACGQIGSYNALIDYAIQALEGKTASSPQEVATFIKNRQVELLKEQDEKIFVKVF